jgi:hypothetical protein
MTGQNVVHVKLDYEESIQAKKDLLSSERDFIRILKTVKRYELLRKKELTTKLKIQNKIRYLKINLGRLNTIFPKIKLPDILRRNEVIEEKPLKDKDKDRDLESQLIEIQERLKRLG